MNFLNYIDKISFNFYTFKLFVYQIIYIELKIKIIQILYKNWLTNYIYKVIDDY